MHRVVTDVMSAFLGKSHTMMSVDILAQSHAREGCGEVAFT